MALLGVRSLFAFRIETLAAAARGPVVRVAYEEAAARDALGIVDARSVEVLLAVSVHADLELDLPVPAPPRPVARPVHEGLPDALAAVVGRDPDVVQERMHLRRQESALADDDVPEELAGRPFRDPSLRAVALDVLLDLLAKVTLPGLPIEPFALVFRQVVPRRLQSRRP